jgi:hypothetical protein
LATTAFAAILGFMVALALLLAAPFLALSYVPGLEGLSLQSKWGVPELAVVLYIVGVPLVGVGYLIRSLVRGRRQESARGPLMGS